MIRLNTMISQFTFVALFTGAILLGRSDNAVAAPDSHDSLTIDEVLKAVLARNPSLAQAEATLKATHEHACAIESSLYPSVNGVASYADIGPLSEMAFGGQKFSLYPANNYDLHIGVDYTLWDFGKRNLAVAIGKNQESMAGDRLLNSKIALSYQVIQIFYTILLRQKAVAVSDEQITSLTRHLHVVQEKMKTGSATEFDTLTIVVQRASAESQRISHLNNLLKHCTALKIHMGISDDKPLLLKGDFLVAPTALNADSLVAAAFERRPDRQLSKKQIAASQLLLQSTQRENYPILSAFATSGIKNGYVKSMPPDLNKPYFDWTIGGRLNVPIFDGFHHKHSQAEAIENDTYAQKGLTETEEWIKSEVLQAKADVEAAFAQIAISSLKVKQATRSLELAKVKFETGTITNTDLLDKQKEYIEAEYDNVQNQYLYVMALLALDKATGKMPDIK
jgi:outer membrane protein